MQPSPSDEISKRLFQAIDDLKSRKLISGLSGFCAIIFTTEMSLKIIFIQIQNLKLQVVQDTILEIFTRKMKSYISN